MQIPVIPKYKTVLIEKQLSKFEIDFFDVINDGVWLEDFNHWPDNYFFFKFFQKEKQECIFRFSAIGNAFYCDMDLWNYYEKQYSIYSENVFLNTFTKTLKKFFNLSNIHFLYPTKLDKQADLLPWYEWLNVYNNRITFYEKETRTLTYIK